LPVNRLGTLAANNVARYTERQSVRWGTQTGYCVVGVQKVPLERPRVRDVHNREVPLGSYEVLQQASLMEDAVWNKIMHGLTTRRDQGVTEIGLPPEGKGQRFESSRAYLLNQ
jgi:hypothetical protein